MITFRFILITLLILLMGGCDLDKYTGYNYEGESLIETTRITGNVINKFTGTPVLRATVKFGDLITYTDGKGDYLLVYPLGTDDERNRPISVTVTRPNYFPIETEVLVYPDKNTHNFSLIYAAPIIRSSHFEFISPETAICFVTIQDYQGVDDIEKVEGTFMYEGEGVKISVQSIFEEDVRFSETTAQYKTNLERFSLQYGYLNATAYQITVIDKSGFTDTKDFVRPF